MPIVETVAGLDDAETARPVHQDGTWPVTARAVFDLRHATFAFAMV